MNILLAVFIPIVVLVFLYLFIIENKGLPDWMERLSHESGFIWTCGVITITILSIVKFLISNRAKCYFDKLEI